MLFQNVTLQRSEDFSRASPLVKVTGWRGNTNHKLPAAPQHTSDMLLLLGEFQRLILGY